MNTKQLLTSRQLDWRNSLPNKLSLFQLVIAIIVVSSTYWVLITVQNKQILQQQQAINKSQGQMVIAKLLEVTSQVESLAISMSNMAQLYHDSPQHLQQITPHLLGMESQKHLIEGGGIWPENEQAEDNTYRPSQFWARNEHEQFIQINDYNLGDSPNYHTEPWYKPLRYFSKGHTYWSGVYQDPHTKTAMVTASVPIWKEHQFIGVTTVDMNLEKMGRFLEQSLLEMSGYLIVFDQFNNIIAYPSHLELTRDKPELNIQTLASQQTRYLKMAKQIQAVDQQLITQSLAQRVFTIEQLDNLKSKGAQERHSMLSAIVNAKASPLSKPPIILSSFKVNMDPQLEEPAMASLFRMPNTYWKVAIITPTSAFENQASSIAGTIGGFLVIIQLLALVVLFAVLNRLFVQPISEMVSTLDESQSHSLQLKAAQRNDEIGMLAKAFISRTHQLETISQNLDKSNSALEHQLKVQHTAKQALKANKNQLNTMLNSSSCLIFVKDLNNIYTLVNDKYCETLGIERQHLVGSNDFDIFPATLAQNYRASDLRIMETTEAIFVEQVLPTTRGEIPFLVNKFTIKNLEGEPVAIGAVAFDFSLQKQIEHSQKQQLDRLDSLKTQQIDKQHAQSELIEQLKSKAASTQEQLQHQQQLNSAYINSQSMMQSVFATMVEQMMREQDQLLSEIHRSTMISDPKFVDTLTNQADQLRHMYQLTAHASTNVKPLHVDEFVGHLKSILQPTLDQNSINLVTHFEQALTIDSQAWMLLLLSYRLISNSISHGFTSERSDRNIHLSISSLDKLLEVSIKDNGVGLHPVILAKTQVLIKERQCQGTLSCVALWVQHHLGGEFTIQSEINKGTNIRCKIPIEAL
ncbi:PAS domain-containing protein [Shewanella gelidii]|uniref:histidine kinase n=1 Tax=Shewanella gelidii TaxID=1642821 RepID=A0A917JW39_9GAMM|nr:PAS domain-containing protein [Shewanella gelidii]MCL1098981.1 PAS domain-containing protein [Shewanella gelidii]GGI89136.1 sensor histidine kinase [Shewanella gelidii]